MFAHPVQSSATLPTCHQRSNADCTSERENLGTSPP
jgi:hypothetical protein